MPKFDMENVGGATATTESRWVNLEWLEEDPLNQEIYKTEGIEELAADIELNGLMQYPLVRYMSGGRYRIISGHRRYKAICLLAKKDKHRWGRLQVILDKDTDETSIAIKLISANAVNRDMTQGEQLRQAVRLHELLSIQKERDNLPGRVRDMVAVKLNMSSGSVGELLAIEKNLNGDWLELFVAGDISKRLAVELSKLDEMEQASFSQLRDIGQAVTVESIQAYKAQNDVSESDTQLGGDDVSESDTLADVMNDTKNSHYATEKVMADNENDHYAPEKVMANNENSHNASDDDMDVSESDTQKDYSTDEEVQRIEAKQKRRKEDILRAEYARIAKKIQDKGWGSLEPCEKCFGSTQCLKCCAGCTERCNVWQPCYKKIEQQDVSESDTSKEAEYIATLKRIRERYANFAASAPSRIEGIEALDFALQCIAECQKKNPAN